MGSKRNKKWENVRFETNTFLMGVEGALAITHNNVTDHCTGHRALDKIELLVQIRAITEGNFPHKGEL